MECFPISLLEAMASARPAVCSAVGGTPEIITDGQTGYLVPPKDSPRLAARLVTLFETRRQPVAWATPPVPASRPSSTCRSIVAAQLAMEEVVGGLPAPSGRPKAMQPHVLILVENFSVPLTAGCGRKAARWSGRDTR